MSVQPRYPPEVARTLTVLDDVCRTLARVIERADDAGSAAAALAAATDWQTASARAFHWRVEGWRRDVAVVSDTAHYLRDEVDRARSRAYAAAWWSAA